VGKEPGLVALGRLAAGCDPHRGWSRGWFSAGHGCWCGRRGVSRRSGRPHRVGDLCWDRP
jgi:hypothetical protein